MSKHRIRMTKNAVGFGHVGDVVDVDDATLRWLTEADACELVASEATYETAEVNPSQETATLSKGRKRVLSTTVTTAKESDDA